MPDEVSLVINISNCPFRCPYCNTKILRKDVGEPLDKESLDMLMDSLIGEYTCVCLMGGDAAQNEIDELAEYIHQTRPGIKVAWYSGAEMLTIFNYIRNYDYIKLGPYLRKLGPLTSPTTNQRFYMIENGLMKDITSRFW